LIVPAGIVGTLMTRSGVTVTTTLDEVLLTGVGVVESVTVMTTPLVPAVVGEPVMAPVVELIVKPAGNPEAA
jgi:hypothetical protein